MSIQRNISLMQVFIIYVNIAFGAGILTLPRSVATIAGEDMWLSVVLGGLAMGFSLWCSFSLSQRFPGATALEYHRLLLGSIAGQLLNVCFILLLALLGATALRAFSDAIVLFMFDVTPPYLFLFVYLGLAAYAGQYGLAPLLRMQQFIIFSIGPVFVFFILLGILQIDFRHFEPFLAKGIMPAVKGILPSWFTYSGPELITGLVFPFLTRQNQAMKTGLSSIVSLLVVYTGITIIVQGILGAHETISTRFPTIMAYREVDIPDTFIERIEGYLLILWMAIYFTSLANFLYFTAFACSRLMKVEYSRPFTVLLVPVFYFIAMLPSDYEHINLLFKMNNIAALIWGLGILPILLLIAKVRNLGGS